MDVDPLREDRVGLDPQDEMVSTLKTDAV